VQVQVVQQDRLMLGRSTDATLSGRQMTVSCGFVSAIGTECFFSSCTQIPRFIAACQ
jgi:hypothetical protein